MAVASTEDRQKRRRPAHKLSGGLRESGGLRGGVDAPA